MRLSPLGVVLGATLLSAPPALASTDILSDGDAMSIDLSAVRPCYSVPAERRDETRCEGLPPLAPLTALERGNVRFLVYAQLRLRDGRAGRLLLSRIGESVDTISEETARKIDHEVRRLVDEGYEEARRILTEHKDELEVLAQGLLEFETLTGEEIKDLLKGKRPVREDPSEDNTPTRGSAVPATGTVKPRPDKGDPGVEPQTAT